MPCLREPGDESVVGVIVQDHIAGLWKVVEFQANTFSVQRSSSKALIATKEEEGQYDENHEDEGDNGDGERRNLLSAYHGFFMVRGWVAVDRPSIVREISVM